MSLILISVTSSKGCEAKPGWRGVAMVGIAVAMVLGIAGPIICWELSS